MKNDDYIQDLIQKYFMQWLMAQRNVSPETIKSYRWNRQSEREPKSEPPLFKTGTAQVVPVLRIATLFGYQHVSQWYT